MMGRSEEAGGERGVGGQGAATAPVSSPQKGRGSGSRQPSRRENGQVREKAQQDRKPGHRVSDRGPLRTRTPRAGPSASGQVRHPLPTSPFTSCSSWRAALREATSSVQGGAGSSPAPTPRPFR